MKNKMGDVRNHLVLMMESLNDGDCDALAVERAKALSSVAQQYIAAVKTEIDALRLLDDTNLAPSCIEAAPQLRAIEGGRRA